ncbi:MAG: hypothetical protein IT381_07545 [Deltaproteobacteria bacterium]|nr:hypothetical protein [Deltaproteobacteria bacterium]
MIDIGNRFGKAFIADGAKKAEKQPAAFEAGINEYLTKFKTQIEQSEKTAAALNTEAEKLNGEADALEAEAKKLRKEAKKLTGTDQQQKLGAADHNETSAAQKRELAEKKIEEADTALAKYGYDTSRINGEKGRDLLFKAEGGKYTPATALDAFYESDAGHAMAAAKNATLWVAGFSYGTHHAMAGALSDLPADKKVTFNVICTPSSHYGSDETDKELENPVPKAGSKRANFESNARTNEYIARVLYLEPGQTNVWSAKELASVKFKVKDPAVPEYASMSPDLTVDLSQLKSGGKLIVEGWCTASAGVGGYEETRRTEIAVP